MVRLIGNVLLALSVVPAVLSVIVYARVDWRSTRLGVHLMTYMIVIATVLVLAVIRSLGFDTWWFEWVRTITYAGMPAVLWWRFIVVWRAQHDSGEELDPTKPGRR